jgi:hypothetical protein
MKKNTLIAPAYVSVFQMLMSHDKICRPYKLKPHELKPQKTRQEKRFANHWVSPCYPRRVVGVGNVYDELDFITIPFLEQRLRFTEPPKSSGKKVGSLPPFTSPTRSQKPEALQQLGC